MTAVEKLKALAARYRAAGKFCEAKAIERAIVVVRKTEATQL